MIKFNTVRTVLAIAAASVAMAASQPALAQSDEGIAPKVSVKFADLDLTSEAGRQTLQSRIRTAAAIVCRGSGDDNVHPASDRRLNKACRAKAMNQAIASVDVLRSQTLAVK